MSVNIVPINEVYKNICLVTFTSSSYNDITKNLSKSIEVNNVNFNLNVFCLDKESYEFNFPKNTNLILFDNDPLEILQQDEIMPQRHDSFGDVMLKKFEVIFESLNQFEYVIYIDGDIVVKKDFLDYISKFINKNEMIFQNDKRPSKPYLTNLCAGFMIITSNDKTKKFFDPKSGAYEEFKNYLTHDQTYINKKKDEFEYFILPLNKFPNGPHFYSYHEILDPYIVHFNYIQGEEKIAKMKKLNHWYV